MFKRNMWKSWEGAGLLLEQKLRYLLETVKCYCCKVSWPVRESSRRSQMLNMNPQLSMIDSVGRTLATVVFLLFGAGG